MATEWWQENVEKLPHEKTGDECCKSERKKEESEIPKLTELKNSWAGNKINADIKLEASKTKLATKPAAKKTTHEIEKYFKLFIVPNVKVRGAEPRFSAERPSWPPG